MLGKNWLKLGIVGVDSGQLLICDPTYIDGQWTRDTEPLEHASVMLTAAGKTRYPKAEKVFPVAFPFPWGSYADSCPELGGMSLNAAAGLKLVEEQKRTRTSCPEFSYHGCCAATCDSPGYGELHFRLGDSGAGVAFSSGYGDGAYEVWGRKNPEGRIVEVRVLME